MSVSPIVWAITLVVLTAILVVDLVVVARRPREPTLRESALWVTGYILLAVLFGLLISVGYGPAEGGKFFAVTTERLVYGSNDGTSGWTAFTS